MFQGKNIKCALSLFTYFETFTYFIVNEGCALPLLSLLVVESLLCKAVNEKGGGGLLRLLN